MARLVLDMELWKQFCKQQKETLLTEQKQKGCKSTNNIYIIKTKEKEKQDLQRVNVDFSFSNKEKWKEFTSGLACE